MKIVNADALRKSLETLLEEERNHFDDLVQEQAALDDAYTDSEYRALDVQQARSRGRVRGLRSAIFALDTLEVELPE